MIYTTPKTLSCFRVDFDRYGDSYLEDTSKEKLAELFSTMTDVYETVKQSDIVEIESRYFTNDSKLGLFRRCR